jgi:predicted acylesterase/phospholipase RssA
MVNAKIVRFIALITCLAGIFALGGCTSVSKRAPLSAHPKVDGELTETIRTLGVDHQFSELPVASVAQRLHALSSGDAFTVLALSGGGASGAFGAGALVGLARSGTRPRFSVVTGVSAGALVALHVFLGQEWDQQLTDAYTGGLTDHLLQPRGLGVIFGSSAYSGAPLRKLVDHYLSETLIKAIADEAASGRLLLVGTTNVDTGETVIWDLGSVAMYGGARAKALIREVLVASASSPGVFPPVIIRVDSHGTTYDEAHVDGTASAPFIVPSAFLRAAEPQDRAMPPPTVYVIVNGRLREDPLSVQLRFRSIMSRIISTGLTHMVGTTLKLTATTMQLDGAGLEYSAIPVAYPYLAPFDFRAAQLRRLFDYGYECARAGRLWVPLQHAFTNGETRDGKAASRNIVCPADDDLIRRFVLR